MVCIPSLLPSLLSSSLSSSSLPPSLPPPSSHPPPSPADVLKFDNSYSWTRPKEVFYSVKVLPPDTELPLPTALNSGSAHSSDSEDEFFDCMADPLDQPVLQTGLTSSAEVTEVEPERSKGTSVTILRTSISTTVWWCNVITVVIIPVQCKIIFIVAILFQMFYSSVYCVFYSYRLNVYLYCIQHYCLSN